MTGGKYDYIYGPVPSWRMGSSLGIDPVSRDKKICSFDCIYCQLGETDVCTVKRKIFVPTESMLEELKSLPPVDIDYVTFSGRGEPTLAGNLGEMIREVKKVRKEPVAVLTNSSLLKDRDVRKDLFRADLVVAKFDAPSEDIFRRMNRPVKGIEFSGIMEGIRRFSRGYRGKLALQIMFTDENKRYAKDIARSAEKLGADEVQLNTPLRPCAVKPLSKRQMEKIEKCFKEVNAVSVYGSVRKKVVPLSGKDTLKRRGKV